MWACILNTGVPVPLLPLKECFWYRCQTSLRLDLSCSRGNLILKMQLQSQYLGLRGHTVDPRSPADQHSQHHRCWEWSHRYTCFDYSQQRGTIPARLVAFLATDRTGLAETDSLNDALWLFPSCYRSVIIPERGWGNFSVALPLKLLSRRRFCFVFDRVF